MGKVEIFDDENAVEETFGFESMNLGMNDVLMPLIPGNSGDYESVFVLPTDDGDVASSRPMKSEV